MEILVVGRQQRVIDAVKAQLGLADVRVHGATTPSGVAAVMSTQPIEHVFMGPGLSLDTRLRAIELIFAASDSTCVHLKDSSRGPEGALDFIRGIMHGLRAEYHTD